MKNKNHSQVVRDWTGETLVLDLVNAMGEHYHFEIEPNANHKSIPLRSSDSPADKVQKVSVKILFPIATQLSMFEGAH